MGSESYDVIIVGGGINGCVAAKFLAEDHDVLVLEKDQLAAATTAKASGLISVAHDYIDHLEAAKYAADFFDEYDGTKEFEFTQRKNLRLIPSGTEELAQSEAAKIEEHFEMEYIDSTSEIEERYPGALELDRFVGAIEVEQGGWVDPYTLTMTYKEDAEDAGAEFETGVEVTGVSTEDGAVTGVETDEGSFAADTVVVAMGWHTKEFVSEWVDLPIRPFRYQWVNLEVQRDFPDYFPVCWDIRSGLYWRPEHNGDLHVGGGTYYVDEPGTVRTSPTESFRRHVAMTIPEQVKDVADARISSGDTCHIGDTATPDERPIHDAPDDCPDGLVISTGMHGFGIMGSPVTGAAVRALVTGEDAPFPMSKYTLDRFDDGPQDWTWTFINESPDDIGNR
ncbi:NAD(P)/FAD-dependent oxidoreductase [Haloferax sp. YSMS24]|uniref:NAD(P)/FAD-dependent oxidoreductase n=1 Tax=Haloferax sp. YSMS24 TaxID=3388425 RepID=UPI00398CD8C2